MHSLGEMAYERYKTAQKGRGARGQKLQPWTKLSDSLQEEWEAAALNLGLAKTAIDEMKKERPSGGKRV